MSIASFAIWRPISVKLYFSIAEGTDGRSPPSIAPAVTERVASMMYAVPVMRASTSATPSKLPIAVLNCRRMRAYAPVANTAALVAPVALDGSEMQRPTDNCSTSIRQPWPASFGPPMMKSSGTNMSLPWIGPF